MRVWGPESKDDTEGGGEGNSKVGARTEEAKRRGKLSLTERIHRERAASTDSLKEYFKNNGKREREKESPKNDEKNNHPVRSEITSAHLPDCTKPKGTEMNSSEMQAAFDNIKQMLRDSDKNRRREFDLLSRRMDEIRKEFRKEFQEALTKQEVKMEEKMNQKLREFEKKFINEGQKEMIEEVNEKLDIKISSEESNENNTCTYDRVVDKARRRHRRPAHRTREEGKGQFALNKVSNFIPHPKISTRKKVDLQSCTVLIYDLETIGNALQDEIVQIAVEAFTDTSLNSFNAYIFPSQPITEKASQITGLRVLQGELYLNENRVESVSARVACQQFLEYLQSFECPLILVAHDSFRLKNTRITRWMQQCRLYGEFSGIVKGFADSLRIFHQILPERKKQKGKFSVNDLLLDYLPEENSQSLHNAIDDVRALKKLLHKIVKSEVVVKEYAKSISEINEEKELKTIITANKASLQQYKNKLSRSIINKMAEAGINQHVMQLVFEICGEEGLRVLLSENVNGEPRITTDENILEKIYSLFPSD